MMSPEIFIPAILLGLAGSMHCILMCGPLALALPVGNLSQGAKIVSRILFLVGRLLMYAVMGGLVGSLGQGISWLGGQKIWLFGLTVFLFVLVAGWNKDWAASIRERFRKGSIRHRGQHPKTAFVLLGMANGLLPCGLVYGALSQSALADNAAIGALLMVVFGLVSSWWHFVLMVGATVRFPKIPILQVVSSPRGSLAIATVFLVLRMFHSPNQIPSNDGHAKSPKTDVFCGSDH